MAKRGVRTAGGGKTSVLWEVVKDTTTDATRPSKRFYALRSDGKLLCRTSSSYTMYGKRYTDSGHWSIAREVTNPDEVKAWLKGQGYTEVTPRN